MIFDKNSNDSYLFRLQNTQCQEFNQFKFFFIISDGLKLLIMVICIFSTLLKTNKLRVLEEGSLDSIKMNWRATIFWGIVLTNTRWPIATVARRYTAWLLIKKSVRLSIWVPFSFSAEWELIDGKNVFNAFSLRIYWQC